MEDMAIEEEQLGFIVLFDITPEGFPWRVPIPKQIEDRRARMSDVLVFDFLLAAGGVKHPDMLYPPRDVEGLKRLLDQIEETTYDTLKKDCLVYFLLKWHEDDRASRFQVARCIPPQFVALADAYWHLDSGKETSRAVALLSDARLNRDYPSKIIQALSLEQNSGELILRYIRSAKPLLTEPDDIDAYSIALAQSSLLEAWQYQRSFPEGSATRVRVLRNVLRWCLTPKPRAKPLAQLLSFPFSPYEQSVLHSYVLEPPLELPIHSIPAIQDLACIRLIQAGRLSAAVKLDRRIAITPIRGTFSAKLSDQARKVAADRKQIMEEIMAVMPAAERMLLEAELDQMPQGSEAISTTSKVTEPRSPKPNGIETHTAKRTARNTVLSDAPILQIPQRSGAPRFGGPISTNATSSFAAVRSMFDSISTGSPAQQPQQQRKPLAQEDTDPIIDSRDAPSVGMVPGNSDEISESISAKGVKSTGPRNGPNSLFDTRGSANKVANAFFNPPPSQGPSVGSKRPRPEEPSPRRPPLYSADVSNGSALDVSEMLQEPEDDDVEMQESDVAISPTSPTRPDEPSSSRKADDGYATTMFSRRGEPSAPSVAIHRTHSTHSTTPAPPGAFGVEVEEPVEREERPSAKTQQPSEPRSPSASRAPPRKQPTRLSRTQSSSQDLARSVPGAFIDEEDDYVAPLPAGRQSRRSSRASKPAEEAKTAPRATRRSSRLKVSGSERGSSPEPVSPEAPRTRRSAVPRTPAKGRTRKQR